MGARVFHACLSLQMACPPSQLRIQLELLPSGRQQRKSPSLLPSLRQVTVGQDHIMDEDTCETRLYVGNLDLRITESHLINMFSPFGKIVAEDFLWHTRGPKRGEPRGFAFIQFSTKE